MGESRLKPPSSSGSKRIKKPEVPPPVSFDEQRPIFSFEFLDTDYCISNCTRDEKAGLADTLRMLSKLTWGQLKQQNRHKTGFEKIARNCIKGHIPERFTEDIDYFLAFRFHEMKPMVGHRENKIFYVIWLDRDFTLYNH